MTKKEKLATEYVDLCKIWLGDKFDANVYLYQIPFIVKKYKANELENIISRLKNDIEARDLKLKLDEFMNIPEGIALKNNINSEINKYRAEHDDIINNFKSFIVNDINGMVDGKWDAVVNYGYKSIQITVGIKNRDMNKKGYTFQFGHEFTISYEKCSFLSNKPELRINYGTLGEFNVLEDSARTDYLMGLAMISNDKDWLNEICNMCSEIVDKLQVISEKVDKLTKKLNNPFSD